MYFTLNNVFTKCMAQMRQDSYIVPHLRIEREEENDHMYLCTDVIDCILNHIHIFSDLKQPWYHWTKEHGGVIYLYFFRNDIPEMVRFEPCWGNHTHFGKSKVGALPSGILKITMNPNSPYLEAADWRFIKPFI